MGSFQLLTLVAAMLVCALGTPVRVPETNYTDGKALALKLNENARHLYEKVSLPSGIQTHSSLTLCEGSSNCISGFSYD